METHEIRAPQEEGQSGEHYVFRTEQHTYSLSWFADTQSEDLCSIRRHTHQKLEMHEKFEMSSEFIATRVALKFLLMVPFARFSDVERVGIVA